VPRQVFRDRTVVDGEEGGNFSERTRVTERHRCSEEVVHESEYSNLRRRWEPVGGLRESRLQQPDFRCKTLIACRVVESRSDRVDCALRVLDVGSTAPRTVEAFAVANRRFRPTENAREAPRFDVWELSPPRDSRGLHGLTGGEAVAVVPQPVLVPVQLGANALLLFFAQSELWRRQFGHVHLSCCSNLLADSSGTLQYTLQ